MLVKFFLILLYTVSTTEVEKGFESYVNGAFSYRIRHSSLYPPTPLGTPTFPADLRARILVQRTRVQRTANLGLTIPCPSNQFDVAVLADDDDAPSGSSTVTSRTPGAGARPEGGASKKAISALLLGWRLTPRLAMALLCRTTCCSSQAREGWRCASWAICARSVFFGR